MNLTVLSHNGRTCPHSILVLTLALDNAITILRNEAKTRPFLKPVTRLFLRYTFVSFCYRIEFFF